ncbi:methionyl-tRNA formyltransferase [Gammaproteobacteria bacterium]|nr:methionyl-tRNA formyltransferase [Gammaproteobacteria bacterium]
MKILFAGSPKPSSEVLEYISKNTPHEVVGVITQPDKRRKRGNLKVESDVSRVAKALAIKTYKPFNLDEEFKDIILDLNFDILLVSAYGKILPDWLLACPEKISINIHYSLLPKYRGASPIQSAIINNDKMTGISFIKMSSEMDEGDILQKHELMIDSSWNKTELESQLSALSISKISSLLDQVEDEKLSYIKQDFETATYCKKIQKDDSVINFLWSSNEIINRFRAFNEWPGVSFLYKDKLIKIHSMHEEQTNSLKSPGQIIYFTKDGLSIKTSDSSIVITHLQFPNKNIINTNDAFNSYRKFFQ